ncbi:Uncharacterised protein [Mycobacteroides abscessus subsp. abscessus]|nr:Uncharacterised protein [Mycobacteroides abscessus subsp. abscessus]
MSSRLDATPVAATRYAQVFSPSRGSGMATTAAFATLGWRTSSSSTSSALIFSPPRLMRSLMRPSMDT